LGLAIAFAEIAPAGYDSMVHQKFDHLALVSTLTTFEPPGGTGFSRKIKPSKLGFGKVDPLHQFGSTDGTHYIKMFRNDERDL
jgi:hypothetical protein